MRSPAYVILGLAASMLMAVLAWAARGTALAGMPDAAGVQDAAQAERPSNPHGAADGCVQCHTGQSGSYARPDLATVDSTCLRCHDGQRAKSEAHPIARQALGPKLRLPDGWPTLDGKLMCLTCHDVLPGCHGEKAAAGGKRFLRDPGAMQSKESGSLAFCAACHLSEAHERPNPHRMITANGTPEVESCARCHDGSWDLAGGVKSTERTGRAQLRADEVSLCGACHTRHVDYFLPGHIGRKAPERVRSALARAAGAADGSRSFAEWLPLSTEGTVVCSTCHNPHECGLFPEGSILARGALQWEVRPSSSILRFPRGQLCQACHP